MKQFSLEEYLKDPSRKVVTRGGDPVRIVCTDIRGGVYNILALVSCKDGFEDVCRYTKHGEYFEEFTNEYDLFFTTEKHEGWINLYKSGINWSLGASIWQTEEEAKKWVGADYVTTIKIEWEE